MPRRDHEHHDDGDRLGVVSGFKLWPFQVRTRKSRRAHWQDADAEDALITAGPTSSTGKEKNSEQFDVARAYIRDMVEDHHHHHRHQKLRLGHPRKEADCAARTGNEAPRLQIHGRQRRGAGAEAAHETRTRRRPEKHVHWEDGQPHPQRTKSKGAGGSRSKPPAAATNRREPTRELGTPFGRPVQLPDTTDKRPVIPPPPPPVVLRPGQISSRPVYDYDTRKPRHGVRRAKPPEPKPVPVPVPVHPTGSRADAPQIWSPALEEGSVPLNSRGAWEPYDVRPRRRRDHAPSKRDDDDVRVLAQGSKKYNDEPKPKTSNTNVQVNAGIGSRTYTRHRHVGATMDDPLALRPDPSHIRRPCSADLFPYVERTP